MMKSTLLALSLSAFSACGVEYFVSPKGNDANVGTTAAAPFKTLAKAGAMFKSGDTLTILPGIYSGNLEFKDFKSTGELSTIRAAIPGTVVLRGDMDAPKFKPYQHSPRIWYTSWPTRPQAVNERDTLTIYGIVPSLGELDFTPKAWFFDEKTSRLYVNTSDSADPAEHYLTIGVMMCNGIEFSGPGNANLLIQDLIITGFNANHSATGSGFGTRWGIYLGVSPKNCTVKGVTAFLNGGGIVVTGNGNGNHIISCRTYGNHSPFYASGGGIIVLTPNDNGSIKDCITFDTEKMGLRYYGGLPANNCVYEGNIGFNCDSGALWMKYPSDTTVARFCYSDYALYARRIERSLFDVGDTGYFGMAQESIVRPREPKFKENNELADPVNFDFRPMADSEYKDRAPAIFSPLVYYVSNEGNDQANGQSIRTPWKTISAAISRMQPGATLYILPGTWQEDIVIDGKSGISIRGRGPRPVAINGKINVSNSTEIELTRLASSAITAAKCEKLSVNQCVFYGDASFDSIAFSTKHSTYAGKVTLSPDSSFFITGCIFDNALETASGKGWAGGNAYKNAVPAGEEGSFKYASIELLPNMAFVNGRQFGGRSLDGMPVGHFWRQSRPVPLRISGQRLLSTTTTTANIEAFTNIPSGCKLLYGETPECKETMNVGDPRHFVTVSLTNLKPNTKYFYKMSFTGQIKKCYTNHDVPKGLYGVYRSLITETAEFTTPAQDAAPKELHVSVNGDDINGDGSFNKPWRTIDRAAQAAVAGDTVLIHEGLYEEMVRIRSTGSEGRPLTFKAAPGEIVNIEGAHRQLPCAFLVIGKKYVNIDNFRIKWIQDTGAGAGVVLRQSDNVILSRLFYDGRGRGYAPAFVHVQSCRSLEIANSFLCNAFHGSIFNSCPDLLIRNCVFYINSINEIIIYNAPGQMVTVRNNIITDNTLQKVPNPVISCNESTTLNEHDNCYYFRISPDLKTAIGYSRTNGNLLDYDPPVDAEDILSQQWRRQGRFARVNLTYAEFCRRAGKKPTSLFENPQMKALPSFITFKDWKEWEGFGKFSAQMNKEELHSDGKGFQFPDDFFSHNPELQKRDIGLQPAAFTFPTESQIKKK